MVSSNSLFLSSIFELGLKVTDPNFCLELRKYWHLYNQYVNRDAIEMYNLFVDWEIEKFTSCNQYGSCVLLNDEVMMEQFRIIC